MYTKNMDVDVRCSIHIFYTPRLGCMLKILYLIQQWVGLRIIHNFLNGESTGVAQAPTHSVALWPVCTFTLLA